MKKILCAVSICLMLLSLFAISVSAKNTDTPEIFITATNATPGDTIDVKVYLKNNPGIVSAKLNFSFDEKLTLIDATNGEAFSSLTYIPPKQLSSGSINGSCQFAWQGFDIEAENIKDGRIITLTFMVSDDVQVGESLDITVSTTRGNVIDKDLNQIMLSASKSVKVLEYLPGDVNEDGKINMLDTILISRYVVDNGITDPNGYNVTLTERAANVNDDGTINMLDVVLLCRYIVDGCETIPEPNGYNVELLPQTEVCLHNLVKTNAVLATCTTNGNIAYWSCSKCYRYYKNATATVETTMSEIIIDATGHTEVIDPAVAPTYSSTGLTEGKHCSTCDTVLIEQQVVDALIPVYHAVSYTNTKNVDISNYPTSFAEHEGVDLSTFTPSATGYVFDGWYIGGNKVMSIAVGTATDVVLEAKWTPVTVTATLNETEEDGTFTVSFNLNGATGTAPATQTVTATNGLTYPAIPTRSGYVFGGWYTTSSCTGTPYNFSATVTENKTLYAKWVSYSGAGYVDYNSSKYVYAYSKSSSTTQYYAFVPLVSGNVTIYTNDTWDTYGYLYNSSKTQLAYDDDSYASGDRDFKITYNVTAGTLYYVRVCGYDSSNYTTVYISGNTIPVGGKSGVTMETQQLTYDDDDFTLTVPEKVGYTFVGWYDGVGGTGTKYADADGDAVRAWDKTQNTTLYAKWVASTYTLTLDNQGGSGTTSVTATYGAAMPTLTAPTKTGYTFAGYYNAVSGGTKYYNADMTSAKSWDVDGTATLYARWTVNTYTITLNNQGGTGSSSVTATYGSALPAATAPTKTGYRFLGYYTAAVGGTQYYSSTMASQVTWNSTTAITLYAQWEIIEYTVTFNTNGGTGAQTAVTATYGNGMSQITVAPTRTGYVFTGYYDAVSGGTKYYNADLSSARSWDKAANATLYAQWQGVTYTVAFNANGGTGTMAGLACTYGTSKSLSSNTFTRTGYTFAGWNTAANGTGTSYANGASVLNLTSVANGTVTLYAKWTPVTVTATLNETEETGTFTVSFNLNGATGTAPATQTVTATNGLTYPAIPTRSGYVFGGWYTTSSCTGTPYNFSATVTENKTLYAKWVSYSGSGIIDYNGSKSIYAYSQNSGYTYYYAFVPLTSGTVTIYSSGSLDSYGYLYNSSKSLLTTDDQSGGNNNFRISYTVTAGTLYYIRVCGWSSNAGNTTVYISGNTIPVGGKSGVTMETQQLTYDDDDFTLTVPERVGYTFAGWYDGVGGTGTKYADADGDAVRAWDKTQNTTLYAKWVASTYTLTLDNQGGSGTTSVTATYGAAMPTLTAPTKTGYTFAGYYNAVSGGTKYYNANMTSAKSWDVDGTATLYARWTVNTYTITLNNQGGTGSSSVTATYGSTLPAATAPTKNGYRFLGYYTAAVGGTQYYSSTMASQVTWNSTTAITLYAQWEAIEYTVTFNTNGGTGAQTAVTATYGNGMSQITVAPTRTGYVFTGYYDAVSGGTKYYNADLSSARSWDKTANATLYAQWQGVTYTVAFNANGGTGTMAGLACTYGTSKSLSSNTFTRTGYTFAGWNTAANGTGTSYANGASVLNLTSVANGTVTLYAKWTPVTVTATLNETEETGTFTVSFNLNGATGTAPATQTVTATNGLTYPAIPTRSGYVFGGWYTTSSCTGTPYNFSATVTENKTLYAKWVSYSGAGYVDYNSSKYVYAYSKSSSTTQYYAFVPLVSGNVTIYTNDTWDTYGYLYNSSKTLLESDDDDGESTNFSISYSVTAGTLYYIRVCGYNSTNYTTVYISGNTIPVGGKSGVTMETQQLTYDDDDFTLTVPEKVGYTFVGWYDGVGGTGTRYADGNGDAVRAWDKTQNTTLYAKWVASTYTLTLDNQGGSGTTSVTATYGAAMPTLTAPTKTGYTFAGYYTAVSGGTKYYNADMTSAKSWDVDGTATLYARWTVNTYTITLNNQGGTGSSSVTATYDSALPAATAPTKTGYRFLGYYTAAVGGTQYYSSTMASQVTWNSTTAITLYAQWEIIEYTVTFNTNGGTGAQTAVTATYGNGMSQITVAPTRTGYVFTGYYDAVSGGTKYYNADLSSARSWDKAANSTLYAQWQGVTYTVAFNANGGTGTMAGLACTYGTSKSLSSNTFTRTGYTFAGWNTAANGTGTSYANGASVLNLTSVAGTTINLYAQWTVNDYELTLDDIEEVKDSVVVTFNKNYSGSTATMVTLNNGDVLPYPTNPTRSGYYFTGWYTTSACTTKYTFSGSITDDMTLYAGWVANGCTKTNASTYPWTVSGNSLTSTNKTHSTSSTYKITATTPVTISFSYKTSSESSYDKLLIAKNGTTLITCSGTPSYVSYSVTLNAGDYLSFTYSKDGSVSSGSDCAYITGLTYTYSTSSVSYTSTATAACDEVAGHIYNAASSISINCTFGETFTLPAPTRVGCTFAGWYDGVGGTGTKYTDADGESVRTWDKGEDATLYAKWIPVAYTITYNLDGGINHSGNPNTYTVASENITLNKPTKEGYSFVGWTTATSTTPVMNYTIQSGSMGAISVTANWIEYDLLDITYDNSVNYVGINTEMTAEYFGAVCLDTDNEEVDITVSYVGSLVAGQYIDVVLTAENNDKVLTATIEDVKVYGTPTITINNTTINSTDAITATTFSATATDSFGGALSVAIELLEGSEVGGGEKIYAFSTQDRCGNIATTNRTVMVYSSDDIDFTFTPATAIKVGSTGEEFSATATDSFGNACQVELEVCSGYTLAAGEVISVRFKATDVNGNEKTSTAITNVKVYGTPTIVCDLPKITSQTNVDDIFEIVDSFGVQLDVTAELVGTRTPGENVGVRLVAQDAAGNSIDTEQTVYVICVNHAISANCTCEICDEVVHTPGEDCECLICGVTAHDLDDACCCGNCHNAYHNFVSGECTACGEVENEIWDGTVATSFAGGSGASTNPYIIETGAQLAYLARSVNNGTSYSGKYFELANDIDLNNLEWTPIGISETYCFKGYFDGKGHVIHHLKVTASVRFAGLFGYVKNGLISNLGLEGVSINSTYSTDYSALGGLIGEAEVTNVQNCYMIGSVYGINTSANGAIEIGGLIGTVNGCNVNNSYSIATVNGKASGYNTYVGGLIGVVGSDGTGDTIRNCYSISTVNGTNTSSSNYTAAGGLVGDMWSSTTITGCYAVCNVTATSVGSAYKGAILGYKNRGTLTTSSCFYANSNVSGSYAGTSTTISNLKSQTWLTSTLGWNFTNTWQITTGEYPTLKIFN